MRRCQRSFVPPVLIYCTQPASGTDLLGSAGGQPAFGAAALALALMQPLAGAPGEHQDYRRPPGTYPPTSPICYVPMPPIGCYAPDRMLCPR
eukprot:822092-Rhodomonas_salina.1